MSLCVRAKVSFLGSRAAPLGALVSKRDESTELGTRGNRLELIRRGTGGRSSFSGIVATVFGASGFLGRYVCNQLGKSGGMMIIPYRSDFYQVQRLKVCGDLGQVLFHPFDLRDEKSVAKALQYSNVVINLIGRENDTANFKLKDVHVDGARRIARLAKENGVEKLIHVSALNAAEKPPSVMFGTSKFHSTKWEGEQAVREEFPEAIIFRPSDIYGLEDRFLQYYVNHWRRQWAVLPVWKCGKGIFKAPVFVSDVAEGIIRAIYEKGNEGEIYQAVGPNLYELSDLLDYIIRCLRRDWFVYDMRFDPTIIAKTIYSELYKFPKISFEKFRQEHTSDVIDYDYKTLEHLGVKLTTVEDRFPYELKYFRQSLCDDPVTMYFKPVELPRAIPI